MLSPQHVPLVSRALGWVFVMVAVVGGILTFAALGLAAFVAYSSEWAAAVVLGLVFAGGLFATALMSGLAYILLNWTRWVKQASAAAEFA